MSDNDVYLNTKGIDQLIAALGNAPVGKIGIRQDMEHRSAETGKKDAPTNAEIGRWHEFGMGRNPVRSFLRMPLITKYRDMLESSGALEPEVFKRAIKEKTLAPWIEKALIVGVDTVMEAFHTGGFGIWPASDMSRKLNHQTLVETKQLRDSIDYEVKK